MWYERGERPTAPRQTEYEYTYVFGAVDPTSGRSAALILPRADTWAMNSFFQELATQLRPDEHAVLVLDNAGWHVAKALEIPSNVSLLHLPPYSPELNPVERVWGYMKRRFLSNRVYKDEEAVIEACVAAWTGLCPARLKTLCGGGPALP